MLRLLLLLVFSCLILQKYVDATSLNPASSSIIRYWSENFPRTPMPLGLKNQIHGLAKPRQNLENVNHKEKDRLKEAEDLSTNIFFLRKSLLIGNTVKLHLADTNPPMYFLSRQLSETIPFSSHNMTEALRKLKIPTNSPLVNIMGSTLAGCENAPIPGENKTCINSLESMVDFVTSKVGTSNVKILTTELVHDGQKMAKIYRIVGKPFMKREHTTYVACHTQPYPYSVYFCHQTTGTSAYEVYLRSEDDGSLVKSAAICHSETQNWSPQHVAFKVLHVSPGGPSICHFLPENHYFFVALD